MQSKLSAQRQSLLKLVILNFALALLYLILGHLGLLLAIPPGYAAAIWPASGVALAGLLLYGNKLWPGILLGSFLINVDISLDLSSSASLMQSFIIAISIGSGAAIQALLGAFLINRSVDIQDGLINSGSILKVLGYGGPVSCTFNATWGVSTLWLAEQMPESNYAYNWMTWWVGDVMGVVLMLPLILIWFGQPRKIWSQRKTGVGLPLVVAFIIMIFVFFTISNQEQKRLLGEFREKALMLGESLEKKLLANIEVLYSLHSLFNTIDSVDYDQFKAFNQRSLDRNPSIQALGWNPVVYAQQRAAFEKNMQVNGFSEFVITDRNSEGKLVTAEKREKYITVKYISPLKGNDKALGYDIYSDVTRRYALDLASSTGELVATASVKLVQETGKQAGVLLMLPVYQAADSSPLNQRESQLKGFVVGVYRMGDLLAEALNNSKMVNTNVYLQDEIDSDTAEPMVFYTYDNQSHGRLFDVENIALAESSIEWVTQIQVGQRTWSFQVQATPAYLSQSRSLVAWSVLALGLLFTSFLGAFLLILSGRNIFDTRRAEDLAKLNDDLESEIFERKIIEQALFNANQELEELATTDALTQVNNRHSFERFCKALDVEVERYQIHYSVIMLDVDHFKKVNDRWGHKTGDRVLQDITRQIQTQLRDTDIIGRWGGEEFVILAKHIKLAAAVEFSKRLCVSVSALEIKLVGQVTISIGVASNRTGEKFEDVLSRADQALYLAKDRGRDRVEAIA